MRFSTTQPPFDCGIALPARTLDLCLREQRGEVLGPRHLQTAPEAFRTTMAP
jgi:hypothetical protein